MASKKTRFEESMKRLEEIVAELERGEFTLEESIKKFEEGVKLGKICRELLEKAEEKIKVLVEDEEGKIREEDESGDIEG